MINNPMDIEDQSRRAVLQGIAATLVGAAVPWHWIEAAQHAGHAAAGEAKITFLGAADAADIEAVAAQIIPTDDTPGAREVGVIYFIDRALGTFLSQLAGEYRAGLAEFQAACRAAHPGSAAFASLSAEQQIAFLKTVDRTPFFETTRILTLFGMFTAPSYGGNRDGLGWTLIGFEDQHAFVPPFGYYDRDYPGFVIEPARTQA